MQIHPLIFRVALAFAFVDVYCWAQSSSKYKNPSRYPPEVHRMYKERVVHKKAKIGVWSNWSEWSPCSRICGGGIAEQTRKCITKPLPPAVITLKDLTYHGKRRKRRQDMKKLNYCVGLYRRLQLCNAQDCPNGKDFRAEQCASFNNRPLKGQYYYWVPHVVESAECALNCWAVGASFYATLNKTVEDGTKCSRPMTSSGRPAPLGTKGVCIEGYCKVFINYFLHKN